MSQVVVKDERTNIPTQVHFNALPSQSLFIRFSDPDTLWRKVTDSIGDALCAERLTPIKNPGGRDVSDARCWTDCVIRPDLRLEIVIKNA